MFYRKPLMLIQCIYAFSRAFWFKTWRRMSHVTLPPVKPFTHLETSELDFILLVSNGLGKLSSVCTGRVCFIRTYILGSVLRRWGQSVDMNIGLRERAQRRPKGHCWLTGPNGNVCYEDVNPKEDYPVFLGQAGNGVCYWAGPQMDAT